MIPWLHQWQRFPDFINDDHFCMDPYYVQLAKGTTDRQLILMNNINIIIITISYIICLLYYVFTDFVFLIVWE